MFINRGNHEAKEMNRTYGFEGEAKHKHGEQSYKVNLPPQKSLDNLNFESSLDDSCLHISSQHVRRPAALFWL